MAVLKKQDLLLIIITDHASKKGSRMRMLGDILFRAVYYPPTVPTSINLLPVVETKHGPPVLQYYRWLRYGGCRRAPR